jgi:hypothetical protein
MDTDTDLRRVGIVDEDVQTHPQGSRPTLTSSAGTQGPGDRTTTVADRVDLQLSEASLSSAARAALNRCKSTPCSFQPAWAPAGPGVDRRRARNMAAMRPTRRRRRGVVRKACSTSTAKGPA